MVIPAYFWSFIVSLLGFAFLKFTHLVHAYHIPAVAALSFLSAIISINQTILLAKEKIFAANTLIILPLILQLIGILLCFYVYKISDSYAYIYASLLAFAITLIISLYLTHNLIHFSSFVADFSSADMVVSFRYGILFQLVEILQLLNLRYYFYQISLQEGNRYLGIYSIGISILEAVWIIPRGISTVHYVSTSNTDALKKQAEKTVQLVMFSAGLCFLALLLIWIIPAGVYISVFGPGFSDVKHSMRFLLPGIFIYSIPIVLSSFYLGVARYKPLIFANLAGFLSLAIFSVLLIPRFVMSGAGLAASLSFFVVAGVLTAFFVSENKELNLRFSISWTEIRRAINSIKL